MHFYEHWSPKGCLRRFKDDTNFEEHPDLLPGILNYDVQNFLINAVAMNIHHMTAALKIDVETS